MSTAMRVTVVIVNYGTADLVVSCLESLGGERLQLPGLKVIVVDNASTDDSAQILSRRLREPDFADWVEFMPLGINGGFGWGNNQAILSALQSEDSPDAILLLNPDARIEAGAVAALVSDMARHDEAASVGSQLVNEDGSLSGSAFRFPTIGREWVRGHGLGILARLFRIAPTSMPFGYSGPVEWVTGACVLMRSAALREAGLFDTGFFLYFEEVELMHRFRRLGWKNYHCPTSRVVHLAGASTGVVDGKLSGRAPPPDYVFEARRRYFVLTHGRLYALLANLAWMAGDLAGRAVAAIFPRRAAHLLYSERAALLKVGILAKHRDAVPAITKWDEAPGLPPAWKQK